MPQSFYITTLGCPKNTADSLKMKQSLVSEGYVSTDDPENSDFHLINTCTFIKSANEETIGEILKAGKIKKTTKQKLIVVGCFAERYDETIKKDLKEVDLCFGTGKYHEAGKIIKEKFPDIMTNNKNLESFNYSHIIFNEYNKPYGYIKISDGCNRGCHFCIIPSIRGKFIDTSASSILEDAKLAIKSGVKEICLVSQDTNFYGKKVETLIDLMKQISEIEGIKLLRLLYLYPDKRTEKLLDTYKDISIIAPYFESPLQHVSSSILKSMNRTGDKGFYKDLFLKARSVKKDLEIRTSFILGFPGETKDDVDEVIQFIQDVKPEKLALFAYSPEEGTEAFKFKKTVPNKEAAYRVNLVRNVHLEILKELHQNRIGKIYDAIVDEKDENGNILVRRFQDAPEMDEIVFISDKNLEVGTIGRVKITSFAEYDMEGNWES